LNEESISAISAFCSAVNVTLGAPFCSRSIANSYADFIIKTVARCVGEINF